MDPSLLIRGIQLGLGAAVPIGPVNVEIARRTLRGGFFAGAALGAGAVSVDVCYASLSSLSLGQFLNRPAVVPWLQGASALLFAYLGVMCLVAALKAYRTDPLAGAAQAAAASRDPVGGAWRGYVTGVLMTALNPMTLAFWFVAVPGLVGSVSEPSADSATASFTEEPGAGLPILCAGVFIGTVGWVICFAGALELAERYRLGRRDGPARGGGGLAVVADAVGGVMMLAFAGVAATGLWK